MFSTATGFSGALDPGSAALELAEPVEAALGGAGAVGGALLLATSASGDQPSEVGRALGRRWPGAAVLGTTFEGLLAGGRAFRDEPAVGVVAWGVAGVEPVPLILESGAFDRPEGSLAQLEAWMAEASAPIERSARDLLLLFPDSLASAGLEASLAGISAREGGPLVAGAAASGVAGTRCHAFSAEGVEPGATAGLLVPGGAGPGRGGLQLASGSRFASPWLEIGACRERWIDSLEGEPPVDWIRRQLGLDSAAPLEPYLDRLLVRIRETPGPLSVDVSEEDDDFVERFVIGLDMRRGSISIPGELRRGGQLAFALPDADRARDSLRQAVEALPAGGTVLQFACRARDATLHGDDDMESALVDYAAGSRGSIGTLAPFQIGPSSDGSARVLVHQTVLAAFGMG
jgi:small ligand-binding sensory domain FIST